MLLLIVIMNLLASKSQKIWMLRNGYRSWKQKSSPILLGNTADGRRHDGRFQCTWSPVEMESDTGLYWEHSCASLEKMDSNQLNLHCCQRCAFFLTLFLCPLPEDLYNKGWKECSADESSTGRFSPRTSCFYTSHRIQWLRWILFYFQDGVSL